MLNEYSALKRVAIRRPAAAFASAERIAGQWRKLNYHSAPLLDEAIQEHSAFEALLAGTGAEVIALDDAPGLGMDALYVRDALIVTARGLVLAAMGKDDRAGEPAANAALLAAHGETVLGTIRAPGKVEGGDLVWLDDNTLLAGIGYRTNEDGVRQLAALAGPGVNVHSFDLPHYKGPGDVFHLMSVLSPLDQDLCAVYRPLMPVRLVELLQGRGMSFVDIPEDEFASMGCNVLALGPRHVVMTDGNRQTCGRLEDAGCRVEVIKADEISRKGEGGPTCLTRPLARG